VEERRSDQTSSEATSKPELTFCADKGSDGSATTTDWAGPINAPLTEDGSAPDGPELLIDSLTPSAPRLQRSEAETETWNRLSSFIAADFGLFPASLSDPLQPYMSRVEQGFSFQREADDARFIYLHVEPLLDQAADLLDRGVGERATWDGLAGQATELALELTEYAALDTIHQEEEVAGIYEVPFQEAVAERDALASIEARQALALQQEGFQWQHHQSTSPSVGDAMERAAWLTGAVSYTIRNSTFEGYVTHTWNGVANTIMDHAKAAARVQFNFTVRQNQTALLAQKYRTMGERESAKARFRGANERALWESLNRDYKKRRTAAARAMQDLKVKAATEAEGLLNYGKRLPAIKARFQTDFRDALARIEVAEQGLRSIYGYPGQPRPTNHADIAYFDDCLLWVRAAIHWLIRFARREQSLVVPISLRRAMGDAAFSQALATGQFGFDLVPADFPSMRYVRMRGLSAAVRDNSDPTRLWQLNVRLPSQGTSIQDGGAAVPLNQTMVPPCLLYRVTDRESRREPDVFGASALHNASPIGRWDVAVLSGIPSPPALAPIEDIELDLHIAFQA
jgi:hypothetical protein